MKYPMEVKLMVLAIVSFTFGVQVHHMVLKYNQAFPFSQVEVVDDDELSTTSYLKEEFGIEYETIMAAAARNACDGDNLLILFAIRKAENGPPGNEFGVEVQSGTDLDTQAGWAAATVMKNRERWATYKGYEELFGVKGFIIFLGKRYCPLDSEQWAHNVGFWFDKFKA